MNLKKFPRIEFFLKCIKNVNDNEFREKVVSIGRDGRTIYFNRYGEKNSDVRLYSIDFSNYTDLGMCALIRFTLDKLIYADYHGMVPVIKWGTQSCYSESGDSVDAFVKYFNPINTEYDDEIFESYMVAQATMGDNILEPATSYKYAAEDRQIQKYAVVFKKYFKEGKELQQFLKTSICYGEDKVLGVHIRGTDYKKNFRGHPVVITEQEYLEETIRVFEEKKYDKVFLATDEESTIRMFKEQFQDNLILYYDVFRSQDSTAVHASKSDRERHRTYLGLEVLRDVYSLAACHGLIASTSNVPTISRVIKIAKKEKFVDEIIINHGQNVTGKKFHW